MCEVCGLQLLFVSRTLDKMANAVPTETDTLTSGLDISDDESDFAAELISLLKDNAEWYIESFVNFSGVQTPGGLRFQRVHDTSNHISQPCAADTKDKILIRFPPPL